MSSQYKKLPIVKQLVINRSSVRLSLVSIFLILFCTGNASAITIAGWSGGSSASTFPPVSAATNTTIGGLTRGSGLGSATAGGAWGGSSWATDEATAISGNKFITFTIAANTGYTVSLSSLSLVYRRSNTGPTVGQLQYAINGGIFTDVTGGSLSYPSTATGGVTLPAIDLSTIAALQAVPATSTITFRIVNWGGTNSAGTWYTNGAGLSVSGTVDAALTTPSFTTNPSPVSGCAGTSTSFTAAATGTASYQWQRSTTGVGGTFVNITSALDGSVYTNFTTTTLNITNPPVALNNYAYRLVATNSAGSTNSNAATLTVNPATPAVLLNQSYDKFIWVGNNTTFNAAVSSTGTLTYQWQYSTGGAYANVPNAAPYSGTTSNTLTITSAALAMNGYKYQCVITGGACTPPITTTPNILNVAPAPTITDSSTCAGTVLALNSAIDPLEIIWKLNGNVVQTSTSAYTDTGTLAAKALNYPISVYVDGVGDVYTADHNNHVYKFVPGSATGTIVAGSGNTTSAATDLSGPAGIFVDGIGNLFVADEGNNRIQKFTPGSTTGITVAGGNGSGTGATQLNLPISVCVDGAGNLYVSDFLNHRVRKFAPGSTSGVTVAGTGVQGSGATQLSLPAGICLDKSGNLYVADQGNGRVQKFAPGSATGVTVAGVGGYGPALNQLESAFNVQVDGLGNIYVSESSLYRVLKFAPGSTTGTIVGTATFSDPYAVFVDSNGNVYVSDEAYGYVRKFSNGINKTYVPTVAGTYTATIIAKDSTYTTTAPVTITPTTPSSVSITANPGDSICAGTAVTFTATPVNSGTNPSYQWKKNDINVGTNSTTYTDNTLADNDVITCGLTTSALCTATDTIRMKLKPLPVQPAAFTTSSASVCSGQTGVVYTVPNDTTVTYNWNYTGTGATISGTGHSVSVNFSNTATSGSIEVTAQNNCGTSNATTLAVTVNPAPVVNISQSSQPVCNNTSTIDIDFSGGPTGTVYNWTNNTPSVGLSANGSGNISSFTAVNSGTSPVTATITVTSMAGSCHGAQQTATITVNPTPSVNINPTMQAVCNNTPAAIGFTGTVTGTIYTWTNNTTAIGLAANGSGNIPSFNATNISNSTASTATIMVTPSANGCTGAPQTATITVNPTPENISSPFIQTVCNGSLTTPIMLGSSVTGTTFTWTNNNTATGLAASGNTASVPAFTATNTGSTPLISVIMITPTANTCSGITQADTITVNPTPTVSINPASQTVCNGTLAAIAFTSTVPGTTYTWVNNTTSIGLAANGSGNIPQFTAINPGNTPSTATITVTPTANSCPGTPQTATVIVNPSPIITATPATQSVCNGSVTTPIAFTSTQGSGTTYTWTNSNPAINLVAAGSGTIPSFTAVNTGNTPVTATISVTPSANTCTGAIQAATITVNPTPNVTISLDTQIICNTTNTSEIDFAGAVTGTTYTWTNNNTSIGLGANGTGSIINPFIAANSGNTAVTATIMVTPKANNCPGIPQAATVIVNPTPVATTIPVSQTVCNGNTAAPVIFTSTIGNTYYTWTNDNTSIGLAAGGTGNTPSFTATNTGSDPVTATITVITTANNCTGAAKTTTITVNPTPTVAISLPAQPVCNNTATTLIDFTGSVAGTTYNWTNNTTSIGLAASGSADILPFTATNPGTAPVTAIITVTPQASGCPGTPQAATITVNPTPGVSSTPVSQSVCNATSAAITFSSAVSGATYSWTNTLPAIGFPGSGAGDINFVAVNTGTTPVKAVITVTPSANGCYGLPQSDTVTVRPTSPASIVAASTSLFCPADSVRITANMGTGLTYQWQFNNVNIPGATRDTFMANPAGSYTAIVTNSYNCPTVSNAVSVTHITVPVALITPAGPTSFCLGDSVLLKANADTGITYFWKLNGIYISAATTSTFMAHVSGNYTVYESDGTCSATTPVQSVTVEQPPVAAITTAGPAYICSGSNITLHADSGNTQAYNYQYQLNGVNIPAGTTRNYTTTAIGDYTVTVTTAAGCTAQSSVFSVTSQLAPVPTITLSGLSNICSGDSLQMSANTASGLSYQWQQNGIDIQWATAASYTAHAAGNYTVKETASNGCSATTLIVPVTVTPGPVAIATPAGSASICAPDSVVINAATAPGYTYQWQQNGVAITGATNASYLAGITGNYSVKVSNNVCAIASAPVAIKINPMPVDTLTVYAPKVICSGSTLLMQAVVNPTYHYQWQLNGVNISGAVSAFYSASVAGNYTVQISSAEGCTVTTAQAKVDTAAVPVPVITFAGNQLCANGYVNYQWYYNEEPMSGETSSCVNITKGGRYTVAVTAGTGCSAMSLPYDLSDGVTSLVQEQITLYPNPATSVVYISAPQSVNASLSTIDGRQLMYITDARTLDISKLANAVYMVKIFDKNNTLIKIEKLVKTGW